MPPEAVPAPHAWHGAIVAGGAARRFGSDKVFATVGGVRLIDAAAASLAGVPTLRVLLGSRERVAAVGPALPAGSEALADDRPGLGPLGGLATALARHPHGWTALLAADMPLVPRCWWPWLAAHHAGRPAIVVREPSGRWAPLAALYHGSLAADLAAYLEAPEPPTRSLQRWLDGLHAAGRVDVADPTAMPPDALLNVNRASDAAEVEEALRRYRVEP